MKGILLAGGYGTRLLPVTLATCKQLLPIFDKPMVYYPLSVLMLAGIREILLISTKEEIPRFQKLFGDGSKLGLEISYAFQNSPKGIAQAFLVGKSFIRKESVALILGDNIFHGHNFSSILKRCSQLTSGAQIFGYLVHDPSRYGVIEFDENFLAIGIEEKPKKPKTQFAIPGLYFYDQKVVSIAEKLKPSSRGELEITDINRAYLQEKSLKVELLGQGYAWLDTGTFDALQKASLFVQTIQERQGIKIACIEEIAYEMGYISKKKLLDLSFAFPNEYGEYLRNRFH